MVKRFTREDGKVAVLISPDHGAGWSTWVSEEDEEALLFHAQIVKAVLDGNCRKAASLAAKLTYHPRPAQQSHSEAGSESNDSSDSEMTMTAIIKNQLDDSTTSAGADSVDPGVPDVPAEIMVDQVRVKSSSLAHTEEPQIIIDCSSSNNSMVVAGSEEDSARTTTTTTTTTNNNPVPVPVPVEVEVDDDDAGNIATAAASSSVTTTTQEQEAEEKRLRLVSKKKVEDKDKKELIIMNDREWLDYCTDYDKIDATWPNSYEYHVENSQFDSAAASLIIEWLEPGEEFFVSEYDGSETLVRKIEFIPPPWHMA